MKSSVDNSTTDTRRPPTPRWKGWGHTTNWELSVLKPEGSKRPSARFKNQNHKTVSSSESTSDQARSSAILLSTMLLSCFLDRDYRFSWIFKMETLSVNNKKLLLPFHSSFIYLFVLLTPSVTCNTPKKLDWLLTSKRLLLMFHS